MILLESRYLLADAYFTNFHFKENVSLSSIKVDLGKNKFIIILKSGD